MQQRLLQGNAINSSDEDDEEMPDGGLGVAKTQKNTTVLHFKRKFKSGGAVQMKRKRAGRFGRQAGYDDGSDSYSSDEDSDDENDFDYGEV